MSKVFFTITLLIASFAHSQCLSGDCKNGVGKYDFGFAVYEGQFQNNQPHGKGKIDYGNGEYFEGDFLNGKEHGNGTLYKKGVAKKVKYSNGKLEGEVIVVGGNAPKVEGCKKGDCYNGYGEILFQSGNYYAGNFKYGMKDGEGKFSFVSGNYFQGTFQKEYPIHGKFFYAKENVSFTGSVDQEGVPVTGVYHFPSNDSSVTIENKKITKIHNPAAEKLKKDLEEYAKRHEPVTCPVCQGDGISGYSRATYTFKSENYSSTDRYLYGEYTTRSYQGASFPNICTKCGGTGKVKP